jgi:hypothetical protein
MKKMEPCFRLSIGARSIDDSIDFFVRLLRAKVLHRDPPGYVNTSGYLIEIKGYRG